MAKRLAEEFNPHGGHTLSFSVGAFEEGNKFTYGETEFTFGEEYSSTLIDKGLRNPPIRDEHSYSIPTDSQHWLEDFDHTLFCFFVLGEFSSQNFSFSGEVFIPVDILREIIFSIGVFQPILLNDDLEIHSYDRVCVEDKYSSRTYDISNVLKLPPFEGNHLMTKVEVPGEQKSINLVLKSQTEMLITHIVIYAAPPFTHNFFTSGCFEVYSEEPTEEQLSKFDGYSPTGETEEPSPNQPFHYFSGLLTNTAEVISLSKWAKGKYFHFKFLTANVSNDLTITLSYIGLLGFKGVYRPNTHIPFLEVPLYLKVSLKGKIGITKEEYMNKTKVTSPTLRRWNVVSDWDFKKRNDEAISELQLFSLIQEPGSKAIILFEGNAGLRRKLQSAHLNSVFSGYDFYDCRGDSNVCKFLKKYIGFKQDVEAEGLFITQVDSEQKINFVHSFKCESELTVDNIRNFVQLHKEGLAKEYIKTQNRKPGDRLSKHPNTYRITSSNYEEVVLKSDLEFVIFMYDGIERTSPIFGTPTKTFITQIADIMSDVHHFAFGIVNTYKNNMNPFFAELAMENMRCWKKRTGELYPCHFDNYRSSFVEVIRKDRRPHVSDDSQMAANCGRLNFWIEFLHEKTETPFDKEFLLEKARQHKAISVLKKEINLLKEMVRKRSLQLFSHPIFEDTLNKEVEELNDEFLLFQGKWDTIKQSKLNKT